MSAHPSSGASKAVKPQTVEAQSFVDSIADLAQAGNVAVDVLAIGNQVHVDPALAELCRSSGGSFSVHSSECRPLSMCRSAGMSDT